jgi:hypothetical protein
LAKSYKTVFVERCMVSTMNSSSSVNVAIVGLGFGAEFIPIYQRHPQANLTAICQRTEASLDGEDHLSFTQGAGHGGSHPHLVHQFVELLRDKGEGYPNAVQSANITLTGILAHESALKNGELIRLPEWSFS